MCNNETIQSLASNEPRQPLKQVKSLLNQSLTLSFSLLRWTKLLRKANGKISGSVLNHCDQKPRGFVTHSSMAIQYIQQLNHYMQHDRGEYETLTASLLNKLAAKLASDQLTSHHVGQGGSSSPYRWSCPQALTCRFRFLLAAFLGLLSSVYECGKALFHWITFTSCKKWHLVWRNDWNPRHDFLNLTGLR